MYFFKPKAYNHFTHIAANLLIAQMTDRAFMRMVNSSQISKFVLLNIQPHFFVGITEGYAL